MRDLRYGGSGAHLVLHLAGFAFSLFVLAQVVRGGAVMSFVVWFVGAAVLHDLVLLPAYSLVDRVLRGGRGSALRPARRRALVNHVRVPAVISGVLLLVYFPEIFKLSERRYTLASGHPLADFGARWLVITAALFGLSGLVYAARTWRSRA
jgi:hypothetical protein